MLAPSAFLASAAAASALVTRLLPANVTSQPCGFVDAAAGEWRQLAGQEALTPVGPMPSFQRAWDRPVVKAALLGIRRALPAATDQARLLAVCSRGASAWLNALPLSSMALRLNNEEVRVAAGLRLGSQLCRPHTCRCGASVESPGLHGLSCARSAGRHSRHAALNNIFRHTLSAASIPASLEPHGLVRGDGKRPDGATHIPWRRGRCLVWDATVVDTFAACHIAGTSTAAGSAAEKADHRKQQKYSQIAVGNEFAAVAFETMGTYAKNAWYFVAELGRRAAKESGNARAPSQLRQQISMAIQRGNVLSINGTFNNN